MSLPIIGYAGMTHLGINSAVATAEKGFNTLCYDTDPKLINRLKHHDIPVIEPDLPELLVKNSDRIRFTTKPDDLQSCDLVFVAADVPTNDLAQSDLRPIDELFDFIDPKLRSDAVMVVLSQVPPGFTRDHQRQGRLLFCQVETLIFGQAISRALHPERYIIGCNKPDEPLPTAFAQFLESFNCPILQMRYESAELAKISINMCLVASISVANTLAEICENVGADWSEIAPAVKLDRRIGQYSYLSPGLGIAGGNLERDLATVCTLADENGADAGVVRAWVANSYYRRDWALRALYRETLSRIDDPVIAILGLAYKQDTDSVKNSPSISLLEQLSSFRVNIFDPVVPASVAPGLFCHGTKSELEACEGADILAVMTPWDQFKQLNPKEIAKRMREPIVVDPYGVFEAAECYEAGITYHTLGSPAR